MELKATNPAAYSLSPLHRAFQTMTIAIHRASPIIIKPTMYSEFGQICPRNSTASRNMRIGPMTQFCTSDTPRTRQSRKTLPISSYLTLAKGGYIIKISPTAIGIDVVPTLNEFIKSPTPVLQPSSTPTPIARNIHSVKNLSRNERRLVAVSGCLLIITPRYLLFCALDKPFYRVGGIKM